MKHLIGLTCPEGLFIELDMFHSGSAENHSADDTIAYGQRLRPRLRGTIIPQAMLRPCRTNRQKPNDNR
jgi:hypothetical protein